MDGGGWVGGWIDRQMEGCGWVGVSTAIWWGVGFFVCWWGGGGGAWTV